MRQFAALMALAVVLSVLGCQHTAGSRSSDSTQTTQRKKARTGSTARESQPKKSTATTTKPLEATTSSSTSTSASTAAKPATSKPTFPVKSSTLKADDGVVMSSGAKINDGSALQVDLIAYKHGAGLDLKGGRVGTSHQPLHKFGTKKYSALSDVPCQEPLASEKGGYLSLPGVGVGFTVSGSQSQGFYRVRVKSVQDGTISIEYQRCE